MCSLIVTSMTTIVIDLLQLYQNKFYRLISIIIPTYNEQENIVSLLQTLTTRIGKQIEVIVVDGGSSDETVLRVADFDQVKLITSEKGRAVQMNRGAQVSTHEVLFFVHADCKLPEYWYASISTAIKNGKYIAGSFYLKLDKSGFWYGLYSRLSKIQHPLFTYGDQGLFVSKNAFEKIGGYPALPIMEDYEMMVRLKKEGQVVKLSTPMTASARKFSKNGVVWQQLKNVMIVLCYSVGVSPARLARWYA